MELFQALGQVVCHKGLSMAAIQNASQAAATLYQWICSIYWYQWALREWQPAMLQLRSCEEQINAEKVSLGDRRLHSEFLRDTTQTRVRELRQRQEHQEKLLQQLTQSLQAKEEASTVESSVAEHLASWTAVAKVTAEGGGPSFSWEGLLPASLSSFLPGSGVPAEHGARRCPSLLSCHLVPGSLLPTAAKRAAGEVAGCVRRVPGSPEPL